MKRGEKRVCKGPVGDVVVELLYPAKEGGWMVRQCDSRSVYRVLDNQLGAEVK